MLTNILQSIGRTPLLRLNALGADLPGTVWLKLENRNPGGSINAPLICGGAAIRPLHPRPAQPPEG